MHKKGGVFWVISGRASRNPREHIFPSSSTRRPSRTADGNRTAGNPTSYRPLPATARGPGPTGPEAAGVSRQAGRRCSGRRSNGRSRRNSRPPGTTNRAGSAASAPDRAIAPGRRGGRATSRPTASVTCLSPHARRARLQACERPRLPPGRLIGSMGSILHVLAVIVAEVGLPLPRDRGHGAIDDLLRDLDSGLAGVVHHHQDRGGHETDRRAAGPLRLERRHRRSNTSRRRALVTREHADLLVDQDADLPRTLLVLGLPPQEVQQGVDRIGMTPVVVQGIGRTAANRRQVLDEPDLGAIDGPLDLGTVAADFQEGRNAERSHGAAKGLMGARHRGINLAGPVAPFGTPRAVGVLPLEQEGHTAADRGLDLLRIGLGDRLGPGARLGQRRGLGAFAGRGDGGGEGGGKPGRQRRENGQRGQNGNSCEMGLVFLLMD